MSSIFKSCFISRKTNLKRKRNIKRTECDSEYLVEEIEFEKKKLMGKKKEIKIKQKEKNIL